MKHHFKTLWIALATILAVTAPVALPTVVAAQFKNGIDAAKTSEMSGKTIDGQGGLANQIINIFMYFIGIVSVIMLIWGGIRYTTSAGDSNKVTSAKNTIIYAVVGIVVVVLAYAIVAWLTGQFS